MQDRVKEEELGSVSRLPAGDGADLRAGDRPRRAAHAGQEVLRQGMSERARMCTGGCSGEKQQADFIREDDLFLEQQLVTFKHSFGPEESFDAPIRCDLE